MSTPRKPATASTAAPTTGRRQSTAPRGSSPEGRNSSPARVLSTHGTAKSTSTKDSSYVSRPNRASVRRPSSIIGSIGNIDDIPKEDVARAENAALVDNLKKSLKNSELVTEDYQSQLAVLQKKLDDLMQDHGKLEEQYHDSTKKISELEGKRKEESRQVRDMANLYESERMSMLRDREEAAAREEELRKSLQRLKETMAGKEMRYNIAAEQERRHSRSATRGRADERSSSVDEIAHQFAPTSHLQRRGSSITRSESKSTSRLVMQKDMVIESLRLELAEAQIKLVEMENMGGDRLREVEKQLLETRMANARLMEDNESFQLLLGEKSLNGDIMKTDLIQGSTNHGLTGLSSLAEELESAEGESENYRRLETEVKSLREQNKALTLYIEKIISRVLQHDNFETILDQKPDGLKTRAKAAPPPPPKDELPQERPSVIQRAMSVVGPRKQRPSSVMITSAASVAVQDEIAAAGRPRPQSQIYAGPPPLHTPTLNEDPSRAPSVPLGRTTSVASRPQRPHRRTHSSQSVEMAGAAAVVNQMYQGPPAGSGGPISPVSPGTTIPRSNYFNGSALNSTPPTRSTSGLRSSSAQHSGLRDSESAFSKDSADVPSPPRNASGNTVYTGAVMTQNKLRPLRLVDQKQKDDTEKARRSSMATAEEEAARKKANRGSWMGWFNRGKDEAAPRSASAGNFPE